jgi:hypothetical protein
MWPLITVAVLAGIALVYEVRKHIASTLQSEGWTPVPAGPSVPTGITKTATGAGVTLAPGNMGSVSLAGASGFPPPQVQVQVQPPTATSPAGLGWIGGITSSNPNVVSTVGALVNPGQSGQMSSSLSVMGPGTSTITVTWNDGQASQTSTFTVVATA